MERCRANSGSLNEIEFDHESSESPSESTSNFGIDLKRKRQRRSEDLNPTCSPQTAIYGHAASRGLKLRKWSIGLDSGCVYGKELSALVIGGEDPSSNGESEGDLGAGEGDSGIEGLRRKGKGRGKGRGKKDEKSIYWKKVQVELGDVKEGWIAQVDCTNQG